MAQLKERKIIELELSTSTPDDRKWVRAYAKPSITSIAALQQHAKAAADEGREIDNDEATCVLVSTMILEWSWEDESGPAQITADTVAQVDPVDFLEILSHLELADVMDRLIDLAKKKSSSPTSPPNRSARRARK